MIDTFRPLLLARGRRPSPRIPSTRGAGPGPPAAERRCGADSGHARAASARLPERAQALFDGPNHVTVATSTRTADRRSSLVWAKADGDEVLFSTIKGRRKYANLTRDPRISALVYRRGRSVHLRRGPGHRRRSPTIRPPN